MFWWFLVLPYLALGKEVINVVLVGATGNLAQKYLWQSFRNIDFAENTTPIKVWPTGTRANMQTTIDSILAHNVSYPGNTQERFLQRVAPYAQLSKSEDYQKLNDKISASNAGSVEVGRIVYLSVPPQFFGNISREINLFLRPLSSSSSWLKVVVEKPFGTDLNSALQLSRDLFANLQPTEVLCVDHYFGKDGVRGIREFRAANPDYLSFGLVSQLAQIEVSMVETEDCAGRTSFYSEVGVLRDTMQNHLMLMLALFVMDMNQEEEVIARSDAIHQIQSGTIQTLGQYETYFQHANQDHLAYYNKSIQPRDVQRVATFAKVQLNFKNSSPFRGIPVVFTSGKALKHRRAYLRALFKNGEHLSFLVQGELENVPRTSAAVVHASSGLAEFNACPNDKWQTLDRRTCVAPAKSPNAYEVLLTDLLQGKSDSFVSIPEVLQAWRIWTPLVMDNSPPMQIYAVGQSDEVNFDLKESTQKQEL